MIETLCASGSETSEIGSDFLVVECRQCAKWLPSGTLGGSSYRHYCLVTGEKRAGGDDPCKHAKVSKKHIAQVLRIRAASTHTSPIARRDRDAARCAQSPSASGNTCPRCGARLLRDSVNRYCLLCGTIRDRAPRGSWS